jgi:UDP-glucose 4-epimerase
VIAAIEKVTGRSVHAKEGPRRPGDPAVLVANAAKARHELGWNPLYPHLEEMVDHAWKALQ